MPLSYSVFSVALLLDKSGYNGVMNRIDDMAGFIEAADETAFASLPAFEPGSVWLVGAGPGDPGLLSLYALYALLKADVVVHDALVSKAVLALAHRDARHEYAGKRGGKPSAVQADISARLIQLARDNKKVLRLKGGDPFIFGRGGEEALALVAAKIPFRVVPGITAGIGGMCYAGIPATHRSLNYVISFVTGHMAGGEAPDMIDWPALAKSSPVIVAYMALKHADIIAANLMAGGRRASEPVAVVSQASLPDQCVLETTLGQLAADVRAHDIKAPAIIVIGEVVRLRAGLDWLGALVEGRQLDPDPLGELNSGDAG